MTGGRAPRDRGRRWQTAVRQWLEHTGWPVHERPLGQHGDDAIVILPGGVMLSVEAKNYTKITLAAWLDQACAQAPAGHIPIVIAHRRGRASPADGYAILKPADLIRLIERTRQ